MDAIIKNVLKTINDNGYEAYLVGGFVRDYLLGIESLDVDICTNALPKDLHNIFPDNNNANNYGGFNLKVNNYNIDITTFREEIKYEKRKPVTIKYINDLEIDIKRRDFTINSICMDQNEKVIDLVNGINDLNKRIIRMTGNIKKKLSDDPLRILRAVRFASILDFKIDNKLYREMQENYELVNSLSKERIKGELTKILLNKNFLKGLNLLKDLKILSLLAIDFAEITYVSDICGMWAQLKIEKDLGFTKQEKRNIISIKQIMAGGMINYKTLYQYGLYNSLVAAEVMGISKKAINDLYQHMPILSSKDLQISSKEILELTRCHEKDLGKIKQNLINLILEEKIDNNYLEIKNYLLNKKLG